MSFAYSAGVITQTGTDTDLSGLIGLTGVSVISHGQLDYSIYDLGSNRLDIEGTLTINPEVNMFITNANTGLAPNMSVNVRSTGTLTCGVKTVVGDAVKYTTGTAFISADRGSVNLDGSFYVESGGTFNAYGATIELAGPARFVDGSYINIESLIIVNFKDNPCQIRIEHGGTNTQRVSITDKGLTLNGRGSNDASRLTTTEKTAFSSDKFVFNFIRAEYQPAAAGYPNQVFLNFDNGNNVNPNDFSYAGSGGTGTTQFNGNIVDFRNVARRLRYSNANNSGGFSQTTKVLNFNLVDQAFAGLSTISYYAIDTDNGSRINFNGFDSTADLIYSGSNAGPSLEVIPVIEYMAGEANTRYIDDRTNNDTIEFKFVSYGTNIATSSPNLIGLNTLNVDVVNATDTNIVASQSVADAYTELETPEKFYDRAKAYLYDNYAGETSTIVSRSGNTIDLGSYDLVIDATATPAFALAGNTITIHADTFTGNLTTTGTITLSNGAIVIGSYTDTSGTTTTLSYAITGLVANSRVQIYNVTTATEVSNAVVAGTSVSGTYNEGGDYTAGDSVRIRVTNVQGVTAYSEYQATVQATSSGWSALVSQELCVIYNTLGIDGSAITQFSADYVNDELDIDTAGNFTLADLYAWWKYNLYTEQGVREFYGGITAVDEGNFRINTAVLSIYLDNTTANDSIQTDNRRLYRDDGARPVTQPTSGGGGVDVEWRSPVSLADTEAITADLAIIKTRTGLIPATV